MQQERKKQKRKDFIQITLLIGLLFLYSYYETKRKEEITDTPTELSSIALTPAPVLMSSER